MKKVLGHYDRIRDHKQADGDEPETVRCEVERPGLLQAGG
jgi:hypothetical protein